MSAQHLEEVRREFHREFTQRIHEAKLPVLDAWFELPLAQARYEENVANWITSDRKRAIIIEEEDEDEPKRFDWIFKTWGDEVELLQIHVQDAHEVVPLVVDCYRLWLLERAPRPTLDAVIRVAAEQTYKRA